MPPGFNAVEPLNDRHETARFQCGKHVMDRFLRKFALANQGLDSSTTFVTCPNNEPRRVAGYYTLTGGSVDHAGAPDVITKDMPRYRIPVVTLARLAVDIEFRRPNMNPHLGQALLKDAFLRAARAASEVGMKAMLVDAIDEESRSFYERFGFEQSPTDPLQLFLPMAVIRASIEAAARSDDDRT
jgi:ribosomal protein S18 acetylase RimI-like enzyme